MSWHLLLVSVDLGPKWCRQWWILGQRRIHSGKLTVVCCRVNTKKYYLMSFKMSSNHFVNDLNSPFSRPCILCIERWRRNLFQLVYLLPSSLLLRGRLLQGHCQVLWLCCLFCLELLLAQLCSKRPCEALLLWRALRPWAPVLRTSLQNTPSNPAHQYVASSVILLSMLHWLTKSWGFLSSISAL